MDGSDFDQMVATLFNETNMAAEVDMTDTWDSSIVAIGHKIPLIPFDFPQPDHVRAQQNLNNAINFTGTIDANVISQVNQNLGIWILNEKDLDKENDDSDPNNNVVSTSSVTFNTNSSIADSSSSSNSRRRRRRILDQPQRVLREKLVSICAGKIKAINQEQCTIWRKKGRNLLCTKTLMMNNLRDMILGYQSL